MRNQNKTGNHWKDSDFGQKTAEMAYEGAEKTKETARNVAQQTTEKASSTFERAKETAGSLGEKARDVAVSAAEKAKEAASNVAHAVTSTLSDQADNVAAAVGDSMKSVAGTIREKSPHEGILGTASSTVARTLEAGGQYLEKQGVGGVAADISSMIRKNPLPALVLGIGVGFLIARATTRR